MSPRIVVSFTVAALLAACSSESVSLEGRACEGSSDCLAGYVCIQQTCTVPGNGDDDLPPPIDEHFTLGATFIVDTKTSDALENFPVLLTLDSSRLDASRIREDGSNLRFADPDTLETVPYDLARWNPTGVSQIWLILDHITSTRRLAIAYGDASVTAPTNNGWSDNAFTAVYHFEPGAESTDASGVTGLLSPAPTVVSRADGINAGFAPKSGETSHVVRPDSSTTNLTIEMFTRSGDHSWTQRYDVALDPPTPVDGFQIPVDFIDVRSRSAAVGSTAIPIWSEPRPTGTEVWARVPNVGTSAVAVYEDPIPSKKNTEAGAFVVMDQGLAYLGWSNVTLPGDSTSPVYVTTNALESTRAPDFYGTTAQIFCDRANALGSCPISNVETTVAIFSGWLKTSGSLLTVGTTSDDSSDIVVGPTAYDPTTADNEPLAHVYHYASANNSAVTASYALLAGPSRFRYRYIENTGNEQYYATMKTGIGAGLQSKSDVILSPEASPVFYHRKIVANPSVPTVAGPRLLGQALVDAGDIIVHTTPTKIAVEIGGATLTADANDDGHAVTVVIADGQATLYIDGAQTARTAITPLVTGSRQLEIGDLDADPISGAPTLDEVRYAHTSRDASWVAAQFQNLVGDGLVTFED